ncbi:MAG: hypothetical protein IKA09_06330, partial [Lachnospiraceae bacterium]|nr:hypothetical protein [Lachnospiraceae bacterium]
MKSVKLIIPKSLLAIDGFKRMNEKVQRSKNMDTYAVVLYFDAVTDRKLKKIIENIALISGNNYMIDVNIPPHITI